MIEDQMALLTKEKDALIKQLKDEEEKYKTKEAVLNREKKFLEKENTALIGQVKRLAQETYSLCAQKQKDQKEKKALEDENLKLKNRIDKLSSSGSKKKLILENEQLREEINKLNHEQENLWKAVEMLQKSNQTLKENHKKEIEELTARFSKEISELRSELSKHIFNQVSEGENNKRPDTEFYAGIIDIPNMKSLVKGWDIMIKDWQEYQNYVKRRGIIISVIGNFSKGKTFLLEKLTEHPLPKGFNVNTQGISILYLKDKTGNQRPIIALDTKGSGTPIDITSNEKNGDKPIDTDTLTEKLRDRGATEELLQEFILREASIIIVVVSDLMFDDQKLVNKINNKFKFDHSKKIIVVHNLFHTHYIDDAKTKIQNSIMPSFALWKNEYKSSFEGKNTEYFMDSSKNLIPHVLLCKDGTEAGDFYNPSTLKYLSDSINVNDASRSVDIISAFHEYLKNHLKDYVKADEAFLKENLVLERRDDGQPEKLKLNNLPELCMKEMFTDVFGDLRVFSDGFTPSYTLYKDVKNENEEYICLTFECPGKCEGLKSRIMPQENQFCIQVRGQKVMENIPEETMIVDRRQSGDFFIETEKLMSSIYPVFPNQKVEKEYKDGLFTLRWKIDKNYDAWQ